LFLDNCAGLRVPWSPALFASASFILILIIIGVDFSTPFIIFA